MRHVVEQGLSSGANHRHDVGAGEGGGLGLLGVVVDVAGGDDDVLERALRRRELGLLGFPLVARAVDGTKGLSGEGRERRERIGTRGAAGAQVERRAVREPLEARLYRRARAGRERAPEKQRDASGGEAGLVVAVDQNVGERHAVLVRAIDAVGARRGPLDPYAGVGVDEILYLVGDRRRDGSTRSNHGLVDGNQCHGCSLVPLGRTSSGFCGGALLPARPHREPPSRGSSSAISIVLSGLRPEPRVPADPRACPGRPHAGRH